MGDGNSCTDETAAGSGGADDGPAAAGDDGADAATGGDPGDGGGFDARWLIVAGLVAAGATGAVVTRRRFLSIAALAGAALAVPAEQPARASSPAGSGGTAPGPGDRPNIIWFRSEDNGAEHIGAYGNALARTPHIDGLAEAGVLFRNFFTTSPVCAPTKLGWATGMYEAGLGPGHNMRASGRRPPFASGFATWLAEAGYWCTTSGNVDYNADLADDSGFHDAEGNWQRAADEGRPFFALLGTGATHESTIANVGATTPGGTDPAAVELPAYLPDDPILRADHAAYLDRVAALDDEVGALLAELDERGVAENTIVIYSSDHGGVLPRSKRFCYDSGLHAPLVARFPERWQHLAPGGPGTVVDTPVSSVDAAPTVLHLAGVDLPEHFEGQPFAGRTCAPRRYAFSNRNRMDEALDVVRTVRDERYRYIRNYLPHLPWGQHVAFMWNQNGYRRWEQLHLDGELDDVQDRFWGTKPFEELYDLDADPDEVTNLVEDPAHAGRLEALRAALDDHLLAINDNGFIPEGSAAEGWEESRVSGAYPLRRLLPLAALAAQRDPAHLGDLREALADENPIVRYWGALGCSMLGVDARPAARELTDRLEGEREDAWVRVQCADALIRIGDRDLPLAHLGATAADDAVPFPVRLQAVRSLLLLGSEAIGARESVAAAATSDDEYVAALGAHALAVVDGTYAPAP